MTARRYGLHSDCTVLPHLDHPGVCNRCGAPLFGKRTQWCSAKCEKEFRANHDWNVARAAALTRDGGRCVRCGGDGSEQRETRWAPAIAATQLRRLGVELLTNEPVSVVLIAAAREPWLEVNHIEPRNGRGYDWGCAHHTENLETLCHSCHVAETRRQAEARRAALNPQLDILELLKET